MRGAGCRPTTRRLEQHLRQHLPLVPPAQLRAPVRAPQHLPALPSAPPCLPPPWCCSPATSNVRVALRASCSMRRAAARRHGRGTSPRGCCGPARPAGSRPGCRRARRAGRYRDRRQRRSVDWVSRSRNGSSERAPFDTRDAALIPGIYIYYVFIQSIINMIQ